MSLGERRLLRRLRDRDERAFREMVTQYSDRVFNLTYRMLGNREEAEDVAQEVFITVFKEIDSFRSQSKLSTWLYRVTINHCKNRIKYLARRREHNKFEYRDHLVDPAQPGAADPARRPDCQIEQLELEALLQRAIAGLDEVHRLLVILRDVEELTYDEISAITGIPEGTVKSRLHRARMALRKKIAKTM